MIAFVGDGGILFALGELSALAEHRPQCTIVVADDGGYGMLRDGVLDAPGCTLPSVDYTTVASAFGIKAETIGGFGDDYAAALARAVESREPHLLHVITRLTPPATTSPHWPLREVPAPTKRDGQ